MIPLYLRLRAQTLRGCEQVEEAQILKSKLLTCPHGFSTRLGGVSRGIFDSLNLGATRGDELENVRENWRRFGAAAGIDTARFVHGRQVHGVYVRVAGREDAHPIGEPAPWGEADGYVTSVKGLPLAVFTADCTPLLLQDPAAGVIGAVHCGWRSPVADIEKNAVDAMVSLGAAPGRIRAAIGPGIRRCCFQTGPEVPAAVEKLLGGDTEGLYDPDDTEEGRFRVDLPGAVHRRLRQLGLLEENIDELGVCTMCHPDRFWSHRSMGAARGSQANLIML